MKQTFLFITLIFLSTQIFSQSDETEMYYPENPLFKKMKVVSVLDTMASPAFHHYKKEYDTLGRQISWRYVEDSIVTRFRYIKNGDTLKKYHFYTKEEVERPVYQTELFVYDRKGNILTYQSCRKNYDYANTTECTIDKFFYDEDSHLTSKLMYVNRYYKQPYSENMMLADSLLELVNVYTYEHDQKGKLLIMRQMIGKTAYRSVDSFYYDKAARLIKKVSRQEQGYLGEFPVINICYTKNLNYEKDKLIETTYITYSDWEINKIKITNEELNEYVFYPNGLKWMWFYKAGDYPKSRLNYLVYEFYK